MPQIRGGVELQTMMLLHYKLFSLDNKRDQKTLPSRQILFNCNRLRMRTIIDNDTRSNKHYLYSRYSKARKLILNIIIQKPNDFFLNYTRLNVTNIINCIFKQ